MFTDRSYQENDSEQLKNYVNQLDEEFRLYLVRDLKVPAQEWSSRQILAEVKAYHSYLDVEHRAQIKRVLFELEKVKNANFTISREDWDQLTVMSQSVVDSIAVALRKSQRRAGRQ